MPEPSADDITAFKGDNDGRDPTDQEKEFFSKFGKWPKKKTLMKPDKKHFDSADWSMGKKPA
jgi:hypothetical protein